MPRFSLIIATIARTDELRRFFVSLTQQGFSDYEVILVDQNDDEVSLAARIHAEEHRIYPLAIRLYQEGRLELRGRKVYIRDAPPADAPVTSVKLHQT